MKRYLVSIIIPVYNVGEYLDLCLTSIKQQSYENIEIILVDDGSKDDSGIICDQIESSDSRFKTVHQPNHGVSTARNTGLVKATGEWVMFVDSDDKLEADYVERYVNAIQDDIDIIFGGYIPFGNVRQGMGGQKFKNQQFTSNQIADSFPLLLTYCTPWGKLFRRSIIEGNNIRFEKNLTVSEDRLFLYMYLLHIQGVRFLDYAGYHYRVLQNSLMNKQHPYNEIQLKTEVLWKAALDIKKNWNLTFYQFLPFYTMHCTYVMELFRLSPSWTKRTELYTLYIGDFFRGVFKNCDSKERGFIRQYLGYKKYFFSKGVFYATLLFLGSRVKTLLRNIN